MTETPVPGPGEKFIHTESISRLDPRERLADRIYLIGVMAVALFAGHWLADRGPSKTDALEAKMNQVAQVVDQNSKAVNDYAGQVNSRLSAVEKAAGVPTPAPAAPKK